MICDKSVASCEFSLGLMKEIGRAIGIGAAQTSNMRNEIESLNAGIVMKEYSDGEAKDFMKLFGQRP